MAVRTLTVLAVLLGGGVAVHAAEKVKLTGPELAARGSGYEVLAGLSAEGGVNFMVVAYKNGTRELYWNDGIKSGIETGTHRFVGDQTCVTWKNSFAAKERCYDVFAIGDDRYESWWNGKLEFTYYKIL